MLNFRDYDTKTGTGVSITTLAPPAPFSMSYIVVAVGISTSTNTVSSVTGAGGAGTFVKATSMVSANRTVEIWVGYNFGLSQPASLTVTRTAGTANMVVVAMTIDVAANATAAPSFTASAGNTATSTTADSNTLTPAVGDILIAATVLASTTADSSARTHTGNTFIMNTGTELTNTRIEVGISEATAAASTKEEWTVSSVEWAAIQALWTPATAPAATAALVPRGLTTAVLDAASSY